jgi:hypothetical protein
MTVMAVENSDAPETEKTGSPQDIFKDTIKRVNGLANKADVIAGATPRQHRKLLIERARLIADLPVKIKKAIKEEATFPEDQLRELVNLSYLATRALTHPEQTFALDLLLIGKGLEKGEPNDLEQIYQEVYGKK